MNTASFLTGRANTTANTTETPGNDLCPPVPNYVFQSVNSSVPYFVNAALNAPLAVVAVTANVLVLLALRRVTSIRLPSKLLLGSLALTDLNTGLLSQPQFAALQFSQALHPDRVLCTLFLSCRFTVSLFSGASFCSLIAISLDRYAALFHRYNYKQIVTTKRVSAVLALIWSLTTFIAAVSLWKFQVWLVSFLTLAVVGIPVVTIVNIKIYRYLRSRDVLPGAPAGAQHQAQNKLNTERYRRSASMLRWVYALFLMCHLPTWGVGSMVPIFGATAVTMTFWKFCTTFMLLNSVLNPFAYCLRLPDVRAEVEKQLRALCCRPTPALHQETNQLPTTTKPPTTTGETATPKPPTAIGETATPKSPTAIGETATPKSPTAIGETATPKPPTAIGETATPKPPTAIGETATPKPPTAIGETATPKSPTAIGETATPKPPTAIGETATPKPPTAIGETATPKPPTAIGETATPKSPTAIGETATPKPPTAIGETATPKSPTAIGETATLKRPTAIGETATLKPPIAIGETATLKRPTAIGETATPKPPTAIGETAT